MKGIFFSAEPSTVELGVEVFTDQVAIDISDTIDHSNFSGISLSFQEAKQLIKFLNEKIAEAELSTQEL